MSKFSPLAEYVPREGQYELLPFKFEPMPLASELVTCWAYAGIRWTYSGRS